MNKFESWLQNKYQLSLQSFGVFLVMGIISAYFMETKQIGYSFSIMFGTGFVMGIYEYLAENFVEESKC